MSDKRRIYVVTLRLTPPQAEAVRDLLATWNQLSGQGASRWTAFYADGDGDFHPHARVNLRAPHKTIFAPPAGFWTRDEYRIDYDAIAWRMYFPESVGARPPAGPP